MPEKLPFSLFADKGGKSPEDVFMCEMQVNLFGF